MEQPVRSESHRPSPESNMRLLGTLVALVSLALFFIGLLVVHARAVAASAELLPEAPWGLPLVGLGLLAASALAAYQGSVRTAGGPFRVRAGWTIITAGLGLIFMGLQGVFVRQLGAAGFNPTAGVAHMTTFGIVLLHLLATGVGVLLMTSRLMPMTREGGWTEQAEDRLLGASLYWYVVVAAWLACQAVLFW